MDGSEPFYDFSGDPGARDRCESRKFGDGLFAKTARNTDNKKMAFGIRDASEYMAGQRSYVRGIAWIQGIYTIAIPPYCYGRHAVSVDVLMKSVTHCRNILFKIVEYGYVKALQLGGLPPMYVPIAMLVLAR